MFVGGLEDEYVPFQSARVEFFANIDLSKQANVVIVEMVDMLL